MQTRCETCGVEFDGKRKDRHHKRLRRFCSKECQSKAQVKRVVPPPEFFQRSCELCGQQFDATPSRPKYEPPKRFCKGCLGRGRNLVKLDRVLVACKNCGLQFEAHGSRVKSGRTQFCSRKCKHQHWRDGNAPLTGTGQPYIGADGYVMVSAPKHPEVMERRAKGIRNNRLRQHRLVMEDMLGRRLLRNETPHHKNGDRADNRQDNLELWIKVQPSGQRVSDLIAYVVTYHRAAVLDALNPS